MDSFPKTALPVVLTVNVYVKNTVMAIIKVFAVATYFVTYYEPE